MPPCCNDKWCCVLKILSYPISISWSIDPVIQWCCFGKILSYPTSISSKTWKTTQGNCYFLWETNYLQLFLKVCKCTHERKFSHKNLLSLWHKYEFRWHCTLEYKQKQTRTLKKMGEEIGLVDDNRRRGFWLGEVATKCSDHMVEDLREDVDSRGSTNQPS